MCLTVVVEVDFYLVYAGCVFAAFEAVEVAATLKKRMLR